MEENLLKISGSVVVGANTAVAIAAKEAGTVVMAKAAITQYVNNGYSYFAPGVIVSEALYALRNQLTNALLTASELNQSVSDFEALMTNVLPPPNGDASLILRADQISVGYGASCSANALYIALADELSQTYPTYLLTFARDLTKQGAQNAPSVAVHLLL